MSQELLFAGTDINTHAVHYDTSTLLDRPPELQKYTARTRRYLLPVVALRKIYQGSTLANAHAYLDFGRETVPGVVECSKSPVHVTEQGTGIWINDLPFDTGEGRYGILIMDLSSNGTSV